eukprot:412154_1
MSTKKSTVDYWGDEPEPQYTEEQKRRIASYLHENDANCKESTTLILIIVIGLLVAMSIVGFLTIGNHSAVKYKGSHTTYEHALTASNTSILSEVYSRDAKEMQAIVAIEEELNDLQPIYRNPLLQKLYAMNNERCDEMSDD